MGDGRPTEPNAGGTGRRKGRMAGVQHDAMRAQLRGARQMVLQALQATIPWVCRDVPGRTKGQVNRPDRQPRAM